MKFKIVFGSHRKPDTYFVDGKEVTKERFDELCPRKELTNERTPVTLMETSKSWPRVSDAHGVHPRQKKKAEEYYRKLGVPTEINAKGQAIIRNNAHQRELNKARGWTNYDGGYGEVTG